MTSFHVQVYGVKLVAAQEDQYAFSLKGETVRKAWNSKSQLSVKSDSFIYWTTLVKQRQTAKWHHLP